MSDLDKIEFQKLAEVASQLEAALNRGKSTTEVSARLSSATGRIQTLQNEGVFDSEQSDKRKNRYSQDAAIAAMVAQESRLNEDEKTVYAEFLNKEYFSNKDVEKIDAFYDKTFDKLSDDGKVQIFKRIDRGIESGHLDYEKLKPETRAKDRSAREEIGYTPPPVAVKISTRDSFVSHDSEKQSSLLSKEEKRDEKSVTDLSNIDFSKLGSFEDVEVATKPDLPAKSSARTVSP